MTPELMLGEYVRAQLAAGDRVVVWFNPRAVVLQRGGGAGHWVVVLLTAGAWLLALPWWYRRRVVASVGDDCRVFEVVQGQPGRRPRYVYGPVLPSSVSTVS